MSIAAHQPRPDPVSGSRLGGDRSVGSSQPPMDLLPECGAPAPAPAPAPHRVLAQDALRLLRLARDGTPSTEIDAIQRQLGPIRSRRALAASYGRESINRAGIAVPDDDLKTVVRVAYALRWLELGPDRR